MTYTTPEFKVATRSFVARLLASVCAINLFVVVLSAIFLQQSRQHCIDRAETQTQNLAKALELTISGILGRSNLALLSISDEAEKQLKKGAIDWQALYRYKNRQHSRLPDVDNIQIVTAGGDAVSFDDGKLRILTNVADRGYFLRLRHEPAAQIVFSKPQFGRISHKWLLTVGRRISAADGGFAGAVQASISVDDLVKLFSKFDLGKDGVITLRDADLDVIARFPKSQNNINTIGSSNVSREYRTLVQRGDEEGTYVTEKIFDPVSRIFSFRKLSQYPFYLNAGRSTGEYLAEWYAELWKTAAFFSLFALGTLFSARLMFHKWKDARLAEIALQSYNDRLESQISERTTELHNANDRLLVELAERIKIEEALKLQEQHLKTIIDTEPDCVKILDRDGALLMMNPAGLEIIQARSFEEVRGARPCELVVPEQRAAFIRATEDVFDGIASTLTFKLIGLKGRALWLESHFVPMKNGSGEIGSLLGITRDITERKLVEEEVRHNERRMASLLRITQHSFTTEDEFLDNALQEALDLTESHLGYIYLYNEQKREFTLNSRSGGLLPPGCEGARGAVYELDGSGVWGEAVRLRKPIMLNDRRQSPQLKCRFEAEGTLGKVLAVPVSVDEAIVAVIGVADKERDYTETDVLQLTLLMDSVWKITTRKRSDQEMLKLEKQLLHAQKLESLGVLAGGIAHDFNNILTSVIGNAELALRRINIASPAADNLRKIELAAARAADLAKQMLAYSGKGRFVIEHIDLNRLLEEMLNMVEVSISKKVALHLNLARPLAAVEADATQMYQVVMNLIINASEAVGDEGGSITITTGSLDCERGYLDSIWPGENLPEGHYVVLEVADTGCGMDKETLDKIFDPFFTTKFFGRGLGLAAVFGIIKGHKGTIKIYSEPGKGSLFKVLLPAVAAHGQVRSSSPAPNDWQASGTVLLVDDEEMVRSIGAEMLQELGFDVITAVDGQEALDIFRERKEIAVVVLDLTMPRLDGEQTFNALRKLNPEVKVIMSSGYNEQHVTQKFVGKGLAGFVQKPYQLGALRAAMLKVHLNP